MTANIAHLKKTNDGLWSYRPPVKAIRNGVVSVWSELDGRVAKPKAIADNKKIQAWKRGDLAGIELDGTSTLAQIAAHYKNTTHYKSLTNSSRKSYRYLFSKISESFGSVAIGKVNVYLCQRIYDEWVEESLPNSRMKVRLLSVLLNHAIAFQVINVNYMNFIKKVPYRPESVTWTRDQVETFIDTAFTRWDWRNIGILVLLCYEYGQRPIDIARLKWESVDFDKNQITIKQSKRGATVYVPMDEQIKELLLNQYQDFKFQEWVIPNLRVMDNCYRPYTNNLFATRVRQIAEEAGLPADLKVGKLRATAIGEMVEAGVDSTGIMQISGHANIQSLNPYLKNTLKGATHAQNKRKEARDADM